jgi:hypothetical protein
MGKLLLCLMATCAVALADELSSLPEAARRTVEANRGTGTVTHVEVFEWGKARIFRVEIEVGGVPDKELQVADTGKLIRVDDLRPPPQDPEDAGDRSPGKPDEQP